MSAVSVFTYNVKGLCSPANCRRLRAGQALLQETLITEAYCQTMYVSNPILKRLKVSSLQFSGFVQVKANVVDLGCFVQMYNRYSQHTCSQHLTLTDMVKRQ